MTPKQFAELLYDEVVHRFLKWYEVLPKTEHGLLFEVIRQTAVDTVASVLGVLDGAAPTAGGFQSPTKVLVGGLDLAGDLQESWTEWIQERGERKEEMNVSLASPAGEAPPSLRGAAPDRPRADARPYLRRRQPEETEESERPGDGEGGVELSRQHGRRDGGDGVASRAEVAAHGDLDDRGCLVDLEGPALLSSPNAVAVEAERARKPPGSATGRASERPEAVDIVQTGIEREIESDQSVRASGIEQGPSEHDEEVRLTPPRHLTPLRRSDRRARGAAVPSFELNRQKLAR